MKRSSWLLVGILITLAAGWITWRISLKIPTRGAESQVGTNLMPGSDPPGVEVVDLSGSPSMKEHLIRCLLALKDHPEQSDAILRELKESVSANGQQDAALAIAGFLRDGSDAITDQPFAVEPGGRLGGAPTLRTFLMDWLPALDPELALELARETLRTTTSPDEYALALRNLAWNDHDGDLHAEISTAFQRMLDRSDWRRQPSPGFLEAFDIAVKLGDPDTFLRLSRVVVPESEPPEILHAACMSMDRMILRTPALLSAMWQADPAWMQQAPLQRASLMSRLDLRRGDHRSLLVSYLYAPGVDDQEVRYFTSLFPNGNHLYGPRLVTSDEPSLSIGERAALDRKFRDTLEQMLKEPLPGTPERLEMVRNRLTRIVEPAEP